MASCLATASYERRSDLPDWSWQYLLMVAEPDKAIVFTVLSRETDKAKGKFGTRWNRETQHFFLQFPFNVEEPPPC